METMEYEYQELRQTYRELDQALARLHKYQIGEGKRREPLIATPENMEQLWETWRSLKTQVDALDAPDAVFAMVKHHFQDFLDNLEYKLADEEKHPEHALAFVHRRIDNMSRRSRKSPQEQFRELMEALAGINDIPDAVMQLFSGKDGKEAEKATSQLMKSLRREESRLTSSAGKLEIMFPDFSGEQLEQLKTIMTSFCGRLDAMEQQLSSPSSSSAAGTSSSEAPSDDLTLTVKMDPEDYRTLLDKKMGVSLDEILSWHKEEIEKTRAEVFEIAAGLTIPDPAPKNMQDISTLLFKYEPPCKTPEEMFERSAYYTKRTRALAHEYVKLPDDEICLCVEVPDVCKDSYPWGGYEGGDFSVRPFVGQMFLNQYNYRNITDGWIRLNALHEAYPGHHVQHVRAAVDETPETVKIGAKRVPIMEGTCLRTEQAFSFIYGEDPFFPLFVAYRRHHAAVRIYVDLMLFYYGATLEGAIRIYEKELGFDRGTARGQVQAHQNMPGYFVCYYYGMKKLCQWEQKYGFSKKDYTELLFSAGYISIDRFKELLQMTPEERERYFHEFALLPKSCF